MLLKLKKTIKPLVEPFLQLLYTKECPVCEKKVKGFTPLPDYYFIESKKHGYPYSPDEAETLNYKEYACANCGASDRERLYALFINKYLDQTKKCRLLDIAPARPLRSFLKRKISIIYRCADLMDKDVDDTGVDIMNMAYPDNSFDLFICSHVLEHVTDDR
ncbi:MAG: methyltransferase domain-containing protein, partial [Bacteroidota bacterium]